MIIEFEWGILDGEIYDMPDDHEIEPIILLRGLDNSLHEYRLRDTIIDQDSGEARHTLRFYQVLPIGEDYLR
jgi:hypothetical protein